MKNALAERFRSWNPSEWDRLSYSINLSMLDDDRATWWVEVNGQRYSSSGIGYEWYGYHSGTFVRYTFYTPPVTSSTESSTGGNTGINLISADLINDKLYYGLMEMDNDGTTTTVTFSIKCNDDVLYSETTVA
jgi:hypothetical protein